MCVCVGWANWLSTVLFSCRWIGGMMGCKVCMNVGLDILLAGNVLSE